MSRRSIDDCEACRDALTELVCEELDTDAREAVTRHLEGCPKCAAELSRMRGVLQAAQAIPLEAPSQRVHDAVMLAAREAQARRGAQAQLQREAAPGLLAKLRAWLASAGTWAMSPQVAMASVLLLMLGVGLTALPLGRDREPVALRATEEAEAANPASATATAAPAAPAMELAPERPADLREAAGDLGKAAPEPKADMAGSTPARRRRADANAEVQLAPKGGGASLDDSLSRDESDQAARDQARAKKKPSQERKSADGYASVEETAFPSSLGSAGAASRKAASRAEESFAAAPPPPSPSAQAPSPTKATASEAESEASPESLLLAQGIRAAQNGDHVGAIAVLRPLAEKASMSIRREASVALARSYRALNDCKSALRYYGPISAIQGASASVLAEAADCYERTGQLKQASVLRSRIQPTKASKSIGTSKPAATAPSE